MDIYMTAQEIAVAGKRLGLSCVPHSKRSVNRRARHKGWDDLPQFARTRSGSKGGGGTEYHVSLLPDQMQAALAAEVSKEVSIRNSADRKEVETVKRQALDTTALTARQRQVMNARSQVLATIENAQITEGMTRTQAVKQFLSGVFDLDLSIETITTANDRSNGSMSLSRATILRWFQFRDATGIGALAPKATKVRADIPKWFWDFLKFYAKPQKPCITEAMDKFLREGPCVNEPVNYDKIKRLIAKLGNVEKHRGREGSLTLKARMAYVTRSTGDLLPTCVYTSDGKTFDAEIAHPHHGRPFRPEITSVVDVATRRCVGFSVGLAENAEGTIDALRHACESSGVCAIFYVDRGSGFKNKRLDADLTGLMGRLGITKYHSLPQNSQARGIIERFHGTVWNKLSREYDTYIGVDMDRQAAQKSYKITRKEIREIGHSRHLMDFDEFLTKCQQAVDAYNGATHSALPGRQSPDEYWLSHVENGFEAVTVTASESADLFRPYVKRRVRRCLLEYRTNSYFSKDLQEYDGDDVLIGYDVHNADHVWVRAIDEIDGEDVPGRLICLAKFAGNEERYVPVTMQRLADEKRAKARLGRKMDQIKEIREELDPVRTLDAHSTVPLNTTPAQKFHPVIEGSFVPVDDPETTTGGSAKFNTDAELAAWALENPESLQPSQIALLTDCLMSTRERELLVALGINIERLITIIQQAA